MVVLAAVTQPAATAGTGVDIEIERTAHQRHPGPGVGVGTAGRASGACGPAAIPPPYSQAELKACCESRSGRWHDDDPLRISFCEYDSKF